MPLPMTPATPAALSKVTNGKVPAQLLDAVSFANFAVNQSEPADRAFRALIGAAKAAGFTLKTTGGYRSYPDQVSLFTQRYHATTKAKWDATAPEHRKMWPDAYKEGYQSSWWVMTQRPDGSWPAMAATPGTSNHGMGYSNDLAEENDGDPSADPLRPELVNWLRAHAHLYGLVNEVSSENWHWTYVTGDDVPPAILQFENPHPIPPSVPTPPPIPSTGALMYVIFDPTDVPGARAQFGGLGFRASNGILVVPVIEWLTPTRYNQFLPYATKQPLAKADLKGCMLLGPIPPGWTSADFSSVNA